MPAMASLGVSYKILPELKANVGFHYYFDKSANYGKTLDATGELVDNDKVIDKNYFEVAGGLEYNITEGLVVSAGYLLAKTGVSADYQSDMSFSLTSSTVGGGLGYRFNENLMVNLGAAYTAYQDGTKDRMHPIHGLGMSVPVTDTYYKNNFFFGIGVDVSF
jgi:long-subunit fatty acid transport protein